MSKERCQPLSVNAARGHLNASPKKYFEVINGNDPEDLVEYIGKVKPLSIFLQHPGRIVSVGVGGGIRVACIEKTLPRHLNRNYWFGFIR